ncbi:MAG TPA: hypothetical protein PKD45_13185 [Flavobacteriales bacterium]|nr:hypothetical protein [Flavobacteriales bacterium]
MIPHRGTALGLVLGALLTTGCANRELIRFQSQLESSSCNQWQPGIGAVGVAPGPYDPASVSPRVAAHFSPNSLRMAHAIHVLPLLDHYMTHLAVPAAERSLEERVELLELRRTIAYHCDLASLEISAVASELDCEEEKISQLAQHLNALEQRTMDGLNVAAIAVGAGGALFTGIHFLEDDRNRHVDWLAIAFGAAEAGLGVAMLLTGKKADIRHPRNALRAIHQGKDPDAIFPASVWFCLTNPIPGQQEGKTYRKQLMDRWQEGEDQAGNLALFLGNGGTYTSDQLHSRASMYDQLESTIKLVKQDLLQLVQELDAQEQ